MLKTALIRASPVGQVVCVCQTAAGAITASRVWCWHKYK